MIQQMTGPYRFWLIIALAGWLAVLVEYTRQKVVADAAMRGRAQGYNRGYYSGYARALTTTRAAKKPSPDLPDSGKVVGKLWLSVNGISVLASIVAANVYGTASGDPILVRGDGSSVSR